MKLLMGFIILLVALVAVTGCTQTASTSAQTTAPATTAAATVATTVATTVPVTTATMVANVTAPAANATMVPVTTTAAPVNVTATATPASMVTKVLFTGNGFIPQTDIVLPGTGVSFVNADTVTHTIMTIGNNTGMFNSGPVIPGAAFAYTFDQNSGTYTIALGGNSSVTGTIIVQASSNANPNHS